MYNYWQCKCKLAPLPHHAFSRDATAVRFYDVTRNCQSQAGAAAARADVVVASTRPTGLVETLEDAWNLLRANPYTCITYKEALKWLPDERSGTNDNSAARRGEFNGVMYKINQHTHNLFANGGHQRMTLCHRGAQHDAVALRQR